MLFSEIHARSISYETIVFVFGNIDANEDQKITSFQNLDVGPYGSMLCILARDKTSKRYLTHKQKNIEMWLEPNHNSHAVGD